MTAVAQAVKVSVVTGSIYGLMGTVSGIHKVPDGILI